MTEQPQRGGSYRREKDGSLTRIDRETGLPMEPTSRPADEARASRPQKRKENTHG